MNKLITSLCSIALVIFLIAMHNWRVGFPEIGGYSTAWTGAVGIIFLWIIYQVIRKI